MNKRNDEPTSFGQNVRAAADVAPRRMSREARRGQLLDAAATVVGQYATTGKWLTFEAIAAEAGVSQSLPFKYFASVDEIALELYERTVRDVDAQTEGIVADATIPFDDKVRRTFELWCDLAGRDGFLMTRLAGGAGAHRFTSAVVKRRERTIELWAAEIQREFGADPIAARLASASVQAGASALIRRVFVDQLDRSEVGDALIALVRGQCEALAATRTSIRPGRRRRRRSIDVLDIAASEIV